MRKPKLLFQEDDALIHGQDPDYLGIIGWWAKTFPGRSFFEDWKASAALEVDHGDSFDREIKIGKRAYLVTYSCDGYSVRVQK